MAEETGMAGSLAVEIVYARPARQLLLSLTVPAGSTVGAAIAASALAEHCPGLEPSDANVGVFGKRCTLQRLVRAGDRIEIYRPLIADPKQARRRRTGPSRP